MTICCFLEYKDRERKKSKYSLKFQRCGHPVITLSNSLLNLSDITEVLIYFYFLCLFNMIVYFLFDEPVNQIFLFCTSKDDIVRHTSEDRASKILQSVLKLITKVRFIVATNSVSTSYLSELVSHRTYHRQCGMTQLCYLGILSTFVVYLLLYLVVSFLLH